MIMKLENENTGFRISTTGAEAKYTDDGEAAIRLYATKINDGDDAYLIEIQFKLVAEFVCKTVNFYESNYKGYQIIAEDDSESCDDEILSGFYRVIGSPKLDSSINIYDPKNRFNLKHYLVAGGDAYFEVLASDYSVRIISKEKY